MRLLLAIDSFKGSLSSREAAEAFEQGFRTIYPECECDIVAIADGGEGTIEAVAANVECNQIEITAHDPLLRPIRTRYCIIKDTHCAIIELASASGLTLLGVQERNPLLTTTFGTGEMVADAIERGCSKIILGIGGSATNDAGVGMLRALGYRFYDKSGNELWQGGRVLGEIARIDDGEVSDKVRQCQFIVACDVTNPLYGSDGAAYIYAPQKGADKEAVEVLDGGLRNFARLVEQFNGEKIAMKEGSGAAGGVGGGAMALLGAKLERGAAILLDMSRFNERVRRCDLVITGEGRIDSQTLMGKAPSAILAAASAEGVATIAIGGSVVECEELTKSNFAHIEAVTPKGMSLDEAMQSDTAKTNIRNCAMRIAERLRRREISL